MSGLTVGAQQADFAARIARITSGAASTKRTIFVGMDDSFEMPERDRARPVQGAQGQRGATHPLVFLAGVLLGVGAHSAALLGRFHVTGLPRIAANPDIEMATQLGSGLLLALVLARVLRLSLPALAWFAGVAASVVLFHNAVHLWPEGFAQAFSPQWVADTLGATEARSLLWRGVSLPF